MPDGRGESKPPVGTASASAANGRDLFYDLASQRSCHGCHAINGVGGKVGPDLGSYARSEAELLSAILKPHSAIEPRYGKVIVTLADGDRIVGIKKDEGRDFLRVYDTTVLPAVLRTLSKSEIVKTETSDQSVMPGDYGSVYTEKQLADLVAFIKASSGKTDR
jgi:putative heme-binding domain-containing protein